MSNTAESLKVDQKQEKDFEEALSYSLTDADLQKAKLLIGVDVANKARELHGSTTSDTLRNWALGVGDDNPLYCDENYGKSTRWGGQIGHGVHVGHVKSPMDGDPVPAEIKQATKGIFRGVHVFVSGGSWEWFRPLRPNETLYSFAGEESLEVKKSEFADRSAVQVRRDVILNQYGEVVGVYRILRILTERRKARSKGKYADIEAAEYTDEDYERIDSVYAEEKARGAEKRWWEDVQVGEKMQEMVKGPLTVTDQIAFHAGGYGFVPYGLHGQRIGYKNRQRIAPFYIKNEHGVWDVAQRLHWDSAWAKGIGNPMAYDYGVMRQAWFFHHVSDWMGDDGFVEAMSDSIRKFNYIGDTQFLSGEVTGTRVEDGRHLVDLKMAMVNQRGTETAYATATVSLPSRESGLSPLPVPDAALRSRTAEMFARHNVLSTSRGENA